MNRFPGNLLLCQKIKNGPSCRESFFIPLENRPYCKNFIPKRSISRGKIIFSSGVFSIFGQKWQRTYFSGKKVQINRNLFSSIFIVKNLLSKTD
jgi:hypothetical protein